MDNISSSIHFAIKKAFIKQMNEKTGRASSITYDYNKRCYHLVVDTNRGNYIYNIPIWDFVNEVTDRIVRDLKKNNLI